MNLRMPTRIACMLISGSICVAATLWSPALGWAAPIFLVLGLHGAGLKQGFILGAVYGFAEVLEGTGAVQFGSGAVIIIIACNIIERLIFLGVIHGIAIRFKGFWPAVYAIGIPLSDYMAGAILPRFYAPLTLVDTQALNPEALQTIRLVGAYFFTGIMAVVGALVVYAIEEPKRRRICISISCLIPLVIHLGGALYLSQVEKEETKSIRVMSVQGGVPNWAYEVAPWVPQIESHIEETYLDPIRSMEKNQVDLVVLPEASIRPSAEHLPIIIEELKNLAIEKELVIVAGFLDADASGTIYNSAFILDGAMLGRQKNSPIPEVRKVITVPVVERELTAGKEHQVVTTSVGTIGILNCVESLHVLPARELKRRGADFLLVLANDAGFGSGTSGRFHAERSAIRAADTNLDVAHLGQFGFTRVYDEYGLIQHANDTPGRVLMFEMQIPLAMNGR
jgi:apolipoprotein N-acyltransferase